MLQEITNFVATVPEFCTQHIHLDSSKFKTVKNLSNNNMHVNIRESKEQSYLGETKKYHLTNWCITVMKFNNFKS